jgi:hypothetical protein
MSSILRQASFVLLGSVAFLILYAVTPKPVPRSVLVPDSGIEGPHPVAWLFRIAEIYKSPYFQVGAFLLFLFLAVYQRNQERSWIYAFLVGFDLPSILFHWILRWF